MRGPELHWSVFWYWVQLGIVVSCLVAREGDGVNWILGLLPVLHGFGHELESVLCRGTASLYTLIHSNHWDQSNC